MANDEVLPGPFLREDELLDLQVIKAGHIFIIYFFQVALFLTSLYQLGEPVLKLPALGAFRKRDNSLSQMSMPSLG